MQAYLQVTKLSSRAELDDPYQIREEARGGGPYGDIAPGCINYVECTRPN